MRELQVTGEVNEPENHPWQLDSPWPCWQNSSSHSWVNVDEKMQSAARVGVLRDHPLLCPSGQFCAPSAGCSPGSLRVYSTHQRPRCGYLWMREGRQWLTPSPSSTTIVFVDILLHLPSQTFGSLFISVSPFIIAEFSESLPHILGPGCTPAFSQLFDETGRNEVPSHLTFRSGAILVGLP